MIEVQGLFFRYDKEGPDILSGIDLAFAEGSYTAIVGQNGCGKTTLGKQLNALLFPSAGRVVVDGMPTTDRASLREIRRRVGLVFQNPDSQIVGMTVEEDVAFGPCNLGLPSEAVRRRVEECLRRVALTGLERRPPHTLSGGEKRLLSLAGVLAMEPRYIILDEPTAYLDKAARRRVRALIDDLRRQGMAIIHITHELREVAEADRLVVMARGAIAAEGAPRDLLGQPDVREAMSPQRAAEAPCV